MQRLTRAITASHNRANLIFPAFYAVCLQYSFDWRYQKAAFSNLPVETALWPIHFALQVISLDTLYLSILVLLPLSHVLAIFYWRCFSIRLFAFLTLLLFAAAVNSHGKINHGIHPFLLISLVSCLLSTARYIPNSMHGRVAAASILFGSQATLLLLYSLSGMWKLVGGVRNFALGHPNFLSRDGFALMVADRSLQTSERGLLTDFIVEHQWVGPWLLSAGILVEISAIFWLLLYRHLNKFAVLLFLLHFGNLLILEVSFKHWMPILALFLFTQGSVDFGPFALFKRRRWLRYRAARTLRKLMVFLVLHTAASIGLQTTKVRTEIFPIFSWALFSHIPQRESSRFACLITKERGIILDRERSLTESGEPNASIPYFLLQHLGEKLELNDSEQAEPLRLQLEKLYLAPGDEYRIVKRKFNLLQSYTSGSILPIREKEIGRFTVPKQ